MGFWRLFGINKLRMLKGKLQDTVEWRRTFVRSSDGKPNGKTQRSNSTSSTTADSDPSSYASLWHALVIIFLEFFSWGLLTNAMINVLKRTFPAHTLLMNGLIQGVKGFLSFLSAPLLGALSDVWGRKSFLLVTVSFTCAPIPLLRISPWWYFTMISISGLFAVTFTIVFAYVADITVENERPQAYGLVSATFAASLIISPSLGAYLGEKYGDGFVVMLASSVAVFDLLFILLWVPESLPVRLRQEKFSWVRADPFGSLRRIGKDQTLLVLCLATFLSYLPEAGQFSSFFVYLKLILGFSAEDVASFIAVIGVLSVLAQGVLLNQLIKCFGPVNTIIFGLICQAIQLMCYGFGVNEWLIWSAGAIAATSSISYPAISAYTSAHFKIDQQGVSQGVLTGVRGLCQGLGPALFGVIFYMFHVDLSEKETQVGAVPSIVNSSLISKRPMVFVKHPQQQLPDELVIPGPPFLFGAVLVTLAIIVASLLPHDGSHSDLVGPAGLPSGCSPSPSSSSLAGDKQRQRSRVLYQLVPPDAKPVPTESIQLEISNSPSGNYQNLSPSPFSSSSSTDNVRRSKLLPKRQRRLTPAEAVFDLYS